MFWVLIIVGSILFVGGIAFAVAMFHDGYSLKIFRVPLAISILGLGLVYGAINTAQGSLMIKKFWATNRGGNWLVVDNSGGETMRHWILEDAYVESSTSSDGWQFYDKEGLNYLGGDSFVKKIEKPLDEFKKDYKQKYNIPDEQEALK